MPRYDFTVELSEGDYLALLRQAPKGEPVTHRLIAADHCPGRRGGVFMVRGSRAVGMALRSLALLHTPWAVVAINKGLEAPEA
jgi:hypothetical protein